MPDLPDDPPKKVRSCRKPYDPTEELTARESAFVEHYVIHNNASKAAEAAGYEVKYSKLKASRLLARPRVIHALAARRAEVSAITKLDAAWVEMGLMREAVSGTTAAARVSALVALGKHIPNFFEPEQHHVITMTDEERRAKLEAILKAAASRPEGMP